MSSYGESHGNTYREVQPRGAAAAGKQGLCGACCCSMIGVLMFFGSLYGIAMNEVSTVCFSKALESARVQHEEVTCEGKDSDANGQLVYLACPISKRSFQEFTPQSFDGAEWLEGAFSERAVKMHQEVSMFQCVETSHSKEESVNGEKRTVTYYEYNLKFSDSHVDHQGFKGWKNDASWEALARGCGRGFKGNPAFSMKAQTLSTSTLSAGDYDVTRHLSRVSVHSPVNLKQGYYSSPTSSSVQDSGSNRRIANDGKSYTRGEFIDYYGQDQGVKGWEAARPDRGGGGDYAEVQGNTVHTCSGKPVLGCLRVSYKKSAVTDISLMAALGKGLRTKAWSSPAAWMCPSSSSSNQVDIFEEGIVSAHGLVDNAQSANTAETWGIRIICFILVIVGVYSFLQPIQAVADMVDQFFDWFKFIPILGWGLDFLGNVVSGAVGTAIVCIAVGIGAPSAFLVLSISWLVMRPIVGVPMVLACVAALVMVVKAMVEYAHVGKAKRTKTA